MGLGGFARRLRPLTPPADSARRLRPPIAVLPTTCPTDTAATGASADAPPAVAAHFFTQKSSALYVRVLQDLAPSRLCLEGVGGTSSGTARDGERVW